MRNRHMRKPAELLLVPMIDIFTVLVTFLLMTAVFSRITVVELDLPSAADGPAVTEPPFRLEVILREEGFELTNGSSVIAAVPKAGGKYDLKALSEEEGVILRLARLKTAVRATLERGGVIPRIPASRIHASVDDAVQAQLGEAPK